MKKIFVFGLLLITVSILSYSLTSCSNANASKTDIVNGTTPVETHDIEWRKNFIATLKPLSPEQRKTRIDQELPRLNTALIATLRAKHFACRITSITYVFGSGTAKKVASGDGQEYNGFFTDQLYAVIKGGECFKDSLMAFVACFNGTFIIEGEDQQTIGIYAPVFTIEKGAGINAYAEYTNSIWLAETFGLTLHEGRGWNGKVISPTEARELYDRLGETAVTVEVYEGDTFDLGNMTLTRNGKITQAKK